MDPEILKAAGVVIGLVIAAPLFYACLKAAAFFGSMKTTVEGLGTTVAHLSDTLTAFSARVTDDLSDKDSRLSVAESQIASIEKRLPERRQT